MVRRETKQGRVRFIPDCTCNTKHSHVHKSASRFADNLEEMHLWAQDHEEMHKVAQDIMEFIAKTGKMQKEDIVENFPEYTDEMLSVAANVSMYPIVFPKRRHAPPVEFVQLRQRAHQLTDEFRRLKYATDDDTPTEEAAAAE